METVNSASLSRLISLTTTNLAVPCPTSSTASPSGRRLRSGGPVGGIIYNGFGNFVIEGKQQHFERVSLVLGGSGITPGYALIARIAVTKGDNIQVRVVDANKSERDILLKDELERFERQTNGQIRVSHILSHPSEGWNGRKGHVDAEAIQELLFEPSQRAVAFLCGPPTMIKKVVLPALRGKQ
jgi:nitrate reductase (NAD(P)H)